jgi:hypothetical protein
MSLKETHDSMIFPLILQFIGSCIPLVPESYDRLLDFLCLTAFDLATDPNGHPFEACRLLVNLCRTQRSTIARYADGRLAAVFSTLLEGKKWQWRVACFEVALVFASADFQEWVIAQFPWTLVGQYLAMEEPKAKAQFRIAAILVEAAEFAGFAYKVAHAGAFSWLSRLLGSGNFAVKAAALDAVCGLCSKWPADAVRELRGGAFFQGVADVLAGLSDLNWPMEGLIALFAVVGEMPRGERAEIAEEIVRGRLIEAIDDANRESVEAGEDSGCESVKTVKALWARICVDL